MHEDRHVRLWLDLIPGSEPIQGRLSCGEQAVAQFTGWLALARAIDTARHGIEPEDGAGPGRPFQPPRGAAPDGVSAGGG